MLHAPGKAGAFLCNAMQTKEAAFRLFFDAKEKLYEPIDDCTGNFYGVLYGNNYVRINYTDLLKKAVADQNSKASHS